MGFGKVSILGVGLIGGAIGLSIRERLKIPVTGGFRNPKSLDAAVKAGAVDEGFMDLGEAVKGCDLVCAATSVAHIGRIVEQVAEHLATGAIVIDVGSTKRRVSEQVVKALASRPDVHFVGCHPLAGSDRRGVDHAHRVALADSLCVITPTEETDPEALEKVRQFWRALGLHTKEMTAEDHDHALARVSHGPHFAAAALALLPRPMDGELASTGFLDSTRIACGDADLWMAVAEHNADEIAGSLKLLIENLGSLREKMLDGDFFAVRAFLDEARRARRDIQRISDRFKALPAGTAGAADSDGSGA